MRYNYIYGAVATAFLFCAVSASAGETLLQHFNAPEMAALCQKHDPMCQAYVAGVIDAQEVARYRGAPFFRLIKQEASSLKPEIDRLNAFNRQNPYNVATTRSAAMMVIEGLGMTLEKSVAPER